MGMDSKSCFLFLLRRIKLSASGVYCMKHWLIQVWWRKDWRQWAGNMMTSSNGNIFCVTGLLCGEFNGLRWNPRTKASDAEPEQTVEQTIVRLVIWDAIAPIMTLLWWPLVRVMVCPCTATSHYLYRTDPDVVQSKLLWSNFSCISNYENVTSNAK